MSELGKNLRHLRRQSSKTQSDIALLLKKGQTTIGNWENGVSEPSLDELVIISNYFGISLDTLVKTDLAEVGKESIFPNPISKPYNHGIDDSLFINEKHQEWPLVLEEVRRMRKELEQIYKKLPKLKSVAHTGKVK